MMASSTAKRAGIDPQGYLVTPLPPTPFGKYTLIGKLGHGGMAEVNLAVVGGKAGFRKLFVIKRLHAHLEAEAGFVDMFLDEARLAAQLNHPNCVQTVEVGEVEAPPGTGLASQHFLAMEYLDGQGLERLLRITGQRGDILPIHISARIIADALDGLGYAHDLRGFDGEPLGVVHRDVSPQNLFLTYNGVVKLLDFGIAKAESNVVETRTGVVKGKYAYIAPEQALAMPVDRRADLWSMGVVLWEMLTSRRLFKSVNELATLQETLQAEVHPPSSFNPAVPPELDQIVLRALQREVGRRYATAQEFKDALEGWLDTEPEPSDRKAIAALMKERFADVIEPSRARLRECVAAVSASPRSVERLVDGTSSSSGSMETSALASGSHPGLDATATATLRPRLGQNVAGTISSGGASAEGHTMSAGPSALGSSEWSAASSGGFTPPPAAAQRAGAMTPSRVSPSRSLAWWLLALAACVASAVVAVVLWTSMHQDDVVLVPSESAPEARASSASSEPSSPAAAVATAQERPAPPTSDPGPAPSSPTPTPAVVSEHADEPSTRDERGAHRRSARGERGERAAQLATNGGASPGSPPAAATEAGGGASGAQSAPSEASSGGVGYLSLITSPWTTVTLNGRVLGETPLVRVALPPGSHTLRLRNPDAQIDESYEVTIRSGELTSRRLGLR